MQDSDAKLAGSDDGGAGLPPPPPPPPPAAAAATPAEHVVCILPDAPVIKGDDAKLEPHQAKVVLRMEVRGSRMHAGVQPEGWVLLSQAALHASVTRACLRHLAVDCGSDLCRHERSAGSIAPCGVAALCSAERSSLPHSTLAAARPPPAPTRPPAQVATKGQARLLTWSSILLNLLFIVAAIGVMVAQDSIQTLQDVRARVLCLHSRADAVPA